MRLTLHPLLLVALVSCQSTPTSTDQGAAVASTAPSAAPVAPDIEPTESASIAFVAHPASTPRVTPTATSAGVQDDALQDAAEMIQRRRELQAYLSGQYIERGWAELERADLQTALESFSAAVEVDPSSQEARDGLRRVRALMGDGYANAGEAFDDESQRVMVKRAQALMEVEEHVIAGDRALREARYDNAVQAYRQAEMVLMASPLISTSGLNLDMVRGKALSAATLRSEAENAAEAAERAAAQAARERFEAAESQRRENRLGEFYELANKAFVADRFSEAETWCRQILLEDPGNEGAISLQRIARQSRHHRADEENRKNYREQWLKTFEELDTMNVPQTDPLKFQLERWREVSQRETHSDRQLNPAIDPHHDAVMRRLESVRFAPNFGGGPDDEGTELVSVAAYMQQLTGVNFWISNAVRDELDVEETSINLKLPERSVKKVLELIAGTSESLRWKIEDGVVMFVTVDEMVGGQVLVTYGIQDLIHPIPDYPGGDINVSPSDGIVPPDEDFPEREYNVVDTAMLEDLIRNNIAPESWDADPANQIRINDNGIMVVNQTPEVHAMINALLQDLREATGIMVDIHVRFMKVEDNFLEDVGIDFRGLGAPGVGTAANFNDFGDAALPNELGDSPGSDSTLGAFLDEGADGDVKARVEDLYDTQLGSDTFQAAGGLSFQWTLLSDMQLELILRAVSKSERIELVTAPRITVHNTSRANLSVLNQVAYIKDFDVEIAQAASIADPIIEVIQDGVILDVRPVVSADRRFVTLELRPTIAQLKRPIEEFVTTIGSQNSVTIMLPEVEIQRVRTSVPLPDGGTVLLGGMKESEKQSQRSGVPILNKIPILSLFFERKGTFISNRKLLILLRANILIPTELAPTPAEMGLTP
jgi:type II secretory pathway component GspD/PulD (secretin)/tetratricopeptide (TPR) repeat protein